MNDKKGVIYILTNPSFPDYVKIGYAGFVRKSVNPSFPDYVKIGYADDIDKRLKQLKDDKF